VRIRTYHGYIIDELYVAINGTNDVGAAVTLTIGNDDIPTPSPNPNPSPTPEPTPSPDSSNTSEITPGNDTVIRPITDTINDIFAALSGEDIIRSGGGNDQVNGNSGNKDDDIITGSTGDDLLSGDRGNDTLTGGDGSDIFQFRTGDGSDIITDFTSGEDKLRILAIVNVATGNTINGFNVGSDQLGTVRPVSFAELAIGNDGTNTTLSFNSELLVTLNGVASLSALDFA
jgi:Ca2+-binding RTX toxin-like protein